VLPPGDGLTGQTKAPGSTKLLLTELTPLEPQDST